MKDIRQRSGPPALWQRVLGQQASFWVSAGVVTHIFWTSAAPAMTYRLYAEQWHLTPTVTTAVFAVYPIVVVAVLVGFGDLSDHIGRRLVMLLGLGASLIGTLLFAVAPDVIANRESAAPLTRALDEPTRSWPTCPPSDRISTPCV